MTDNAPYFFCGVGGSGMLPLALILRGQGLTVEGSDRSHDQGRTPEKFDFLRAQGVRLFPQDGSGVTRADQRVVISAAVEETVPDVQAARRVGASLVKRAELLADLFNAAPRAIAVGGTSGKSTTTGMIGWILTEAGLDPTIMNGAVMKNFVRADALFASARVGKGDIFVSEVDESDGSIALYRPRIAVLNNLALDHKSLNELRTLFSDFIGKGETVVLNLDNADVAALAPSAPGKRLTYSLDNPAANFLAAHIMPQPDGILFEVRERDGDVVDVRLRTPGRHNVSNALAAIAAARAIGVPLSQAVESLKRFSGIRRRLEFVGSRGGVTVFDDFAHNPDKIEATLKTLHDFPGRLLIMFQPHGFGPLKHMKDALIDCFARNLAVEDVLLMPEPVYFGGTVDRSVGSAEIVSGIAAAGRTALALPDRAACGEELLKLAKPGDRIIIMGARDDTLSQFAADILARVAG
ncbi:MAG TPA: Mur ligase family protein [Caulobacterales bacterium]|nr:Mur ligase family protein [Caulobacterales bacterium]